MVPRLASRTRLLQALAKAVEDLDVDRDALPDALRHRAELLELSERAIEVLELRPRDAEADVHADPLHPQPVLGVAVDHRLRLRPERLGRLLELAQREQ